MSWKDHAPLAAGKAKAAEAAGAVTLAAVAAGGRIELRLVVRRPVLEHLGWWRDGQGVAVLVGEGLDEGRLRIARGGACVLRGAPARLDRLPPVTLAVPGFAWMPPGFAAPAQAVTHRVAARGTELEVELPEWARRGWRGAVAAGDAEQERRAGRRRA